jgi:uncharacterized protein (DUF2147 family)
VRRTCMAFAGLCLSVQACFADPIGEWMTQKGYAKIRIENCGNALWGAVSWEQRPGGVDSKNPDPNKRGRPTLGLPVLLDMKPEGDNKWVGQIYNSEDGKTYASNISMGSPDLLQVRGCVLGILCGGEDWSRVKDDPTAQPPTPGAPATTRPGATAPNQPPRPGASAAPTQPKPGAAAPPAAPAKPVDIATASVDDFCSAVLNSAGLPH